MDNMSKMKVPTMEEINQNAIDHREDAAYRMGKMSGYAAVMAALSEAREQLLPQLEQADELYGVDEYIKRVFEITSEVMSWSIPEDKRKDIEGAVELIKDNMLKDATK